MAHHIALIDEQAGEVRGIGTGLTLSTAYEHALRDFRLWFPVERRTGRLVSREISHDTICAIRRGIVSTAELGI